MIIVFVHLFKALLNIRDHSNQCYRSILVGEGNSLRLFFFLLIDLYLVLNSGQSYKIITCIATLYYGYYVVMSLRECNNDYMIYECETTKSTH